MAEASFSQEQFSCPVCLDLLNDPVAIPCGHSFCKSCITCCWDQEDQKEAYSCPECRQTFTSRPALNKNTLLAEVVEQLKKTKLQADVPAGLEDVESDICTGRKHKKEKKTSGKKHLMILKERQSKFQQRIQQREKDLEELRKAVESHKRSADTAVEDSERILIELLRSIENICSKVTQRIRDQEKAAVSRAEGFMDRLEHEIDDFRRRDAELELLLHTDDHIHFLQSFQSLSEPCESTDVTSITVSSLLSFNDVGKSVYQLKEKLLDFCTEEIDKISGRAAYIEIIRTNEPKIRDEFLQYSSQFTLDPNTMNNKLQLSERNRVITFTNTVQQYPDHPDRFHFYPQVLCREGVCGRCYWELEWSGRLGVDISVSYKSISRRGGRNECVFGYNDQSWTLSCFPSSYSFWLNNSYIELPVHVSGCRIGVYVDHSAGTLSFYSVSDTMTLIHRAKTTFTQPLYPGFGLSNKSTLRLCDLTQ